MTSAIVAGNGIDIHYRIDGDGPETLVLINGVGVSLDELAAQLKAAQARDAKMSVAIKGDSGAQYAKVVAIIDLCDQLHVNMGIVTSRIGR